MATRSVPKLYRHTPLARRPVRDVPQDGPAEADWMARAGDLGRTLKSKADAAPDLGVLRARLPAFSAPTLADVLAPERNSFGVMRFLLAAAVLISHAFFLHYGRVAAEPLYGLTGYTLGQHAVQVFFFLSGVLVTQSLAESRDIRDYVTARALRIFPALIVCVLLTAFVLGPWLTTIGRDAYFKDAGVLDYVWRTIALTTGSATLPGLFDANTVPGVVNTSLWTLKYEVLCYAVLAVIGAAAFLSGRTAAVVAGVAVLWFAVILTKRPELAADAKPAAVMAYFSLFFGAGAVAWLLREQIRLHGAIVAALGALAVYTTRTSFAEIALAMFLGYGVLWLSTFQFGGWRAFANTSDLSYGVYIYSMPVTQALIALQPGINLVSLIAAASGITIAIAFLSWELIERPALALRRKLRRRQPARTVIGTPEVAPAARKEASRQRLPKSSRPARTATELTTTLSAEPVMPPKPAVSGDRLRFAVRKTDTPALSEVERRELVDRLRARKLERVVH